MSKGEAARQGESDELSRLRTEHEELLRLRAKAASVPQSKAPTAKPGSATAKAPRVAETPSIPLLPAGAWANVGTATPAAAMQTLFWASAKQDTNALVKSLVWDPAAKAKLDGLFAAAPESLRQQFGSVEGLIYEMALGAMTGE